MSRRLYLIKPDDRRNGHSRTVDFTAIELFLVRERVFAEMFTEYTSCCLPHEPLTKTVYQSVYLTAGK